MNIISIGLRRLLAWLTEIDRPAEPGLLFCADLPPYHPGEREPRRSR